MLVDDSMGKPEYGIRVFLKLGESIEYRKKVEDMANTMFSMHIL